MNLTEKSVDFIQVHGLRFVIWMVAMNFLDEALLPLSLWYFGKPALAVVSMLGDLDFITYPSYFFFANLISKLKHGGLRI